MNDFDWKSLSEGFDEPVNDIQGIIADPPWAFIVEDGRNDGACKLTPSEFVSPLVIQSVAPKYQRANFGY